MSIEEFEKLKADEMRAALAERNIKVPARATKSVMVEAFRSAMEALVSSVHGGPVKLGDHNEIDAVVITPSENPQDVFKPVTVDMECANQIVWPERKPAPARDTSALDRLRNLPERNRHERRRKEALLRQAMRAFA